MAAILFGSIGSLADTSELQRLSFNEAFCQSGLDWRWSPGQYTDLLHCSGGRRRIAAYMEQVNQLVDIEAIYQLKSQIFCQAMTASGVESRSGVMETIRLARRNGYRLALVTTTELRVVEALLSALELQIRAEDFDCITSFEDVEAAKPASRAYELALERLEIAADEAIAIEDNLDGLAAARAAGLDCVAFPGAMTSAHCFVGAVLRRRRLEFSVLAEQLERKQGRVEHWRSPRLSVA